MWKRTALILTILIGLGYIGYRILQSEFNPAAAAGEATGTLNYVVVDTGQNQCYDSTNQISCPQAGQSFYGQDAQYAGNQPSYVNNGNGTVTDLNTGLMWQQTPGDKVTYVEAVAGADSFNLAGYDDWRLPTIKELYSLIDFSGRDPSGWNGTDISSLTPFIDTDYFDFEYGDISAGERIIDAQYWSSSEYVATTMNGMHTVFGVNFADGRIKGYGTSRPDGASMTQFVRYVRGNLDYSVNDFSANNDGTITDQATGLMWQQADSGAAYLWSEALNYCENLSLATHDDWRLPNAKELQSIVDYARSPATTNSAAIDPLFSISSITDEGGETNYPFYWSSTTHANWSTAPGRAAAYVAFGEALGWMQSPDGSYSLMDVHGAGAQRSDPKTGDPADYPYGHGPQGDVVRIDNYVRCVRDADAGTEPTPAPDYSHQDYLPLITSDASEQSSNAEDYILFTPLRSTTTYLMDSEGNAVYTWESNYRPGNSVYLLENGNLLRTGTVNASDFDTGGAGGVVQEISPDSTVVWEFQYSSGQVRLHHDIEPLPNGNVLMLAWEYKTEAEALAAGRNPTLLTDGELWPDHVIEVNPSTNAVVWEWHIWDHLVQDYDPSKVNYDVVADHPELIDLNYSTGGPPGGADWNHSNSIDYNAALDQVLISVHNFSEIWIIDHSTTTAEAAGHTGGNSGKGGDLLYRWGNPQAYDVGTAADQQLFVQHDAQWIPTNYPGAGNILVFNNGMGRPDGNYSSVDEIVPPVDNAGTYALDANSAFGPAAPVWSYSASNQSDFFATNISGAQRLPDGNTLICDGPSGVFFEVTPASETVWSYDYGSNVFRVTRYPADYAGLSSLTLQSTFAIPTAESNQQLGPGGLAGSSSSNAQPNSAAATNPRLAAVNACTNLTQNQACQFNAPRGTVNGACTLVQNQLACVPSELPIPRSP